MVFLSADEFQEDCWTLAEKLYASGWRPDYLLGLWRGGAWPCVSVDECFRTKGWKTDCIPLKCWSYSGVNSNEGELKFFLEKEVFSCLQPGKRVLVIDDVFDTGKTAAEVLKRLKERGLEARFASVYFKPEKNQTSIKPDYYVKELGNDWIAFPTEYEFVRPTQV